MAAGKITFLRDLRHIPPKGLGHSINGAEKSTWHIATKLLL